MPRPVFLLLLLAACRTQTEAPAAASRTANFSTTSLPCLIPAGTAPRAGASPAALTMSGPDWCLPVLDTFLAKNPDSRIVTVLPIEFRLENEEPGVRDQGTQELLVVLADAGDWPRARELQASLISCSSVGRGPKACGSAILGSAALIPQTVFWVPLSRMHDTPQAEAGTRYVIMGWLKS